MREGEKVANIAFNEQDNFPKILFYEALILRSEMKSVQRLDDCHLDPQNVNNEKVKYLIPAVLYKFTQWLASSERKFDAEVDLSDELLKTQVHQTERAALSICQNLMFANSSGEKNAKTCWACSYSSPHLESEKPGYAASGHGHCISCDALKRIDPIREKMMESLDGNPYTVIPSNTVDGVFTQAAEDNADFNSNNLDGKDSAHITSVLYQEMSQSMTGLFGRNFDPDKIKRRSINIGERKILRSKPILVRIEPRFEGNINSSLLFQLAAWQSPFKLINWSWLYCRMAPITHFEVKILSRNEVQGIPQWTGFNTL